jgi:ornithine decarboxylase
VVSDAGTLVATVIAVVHRGATRWVYLDAGVFTGLVETLDEAIRYRIRTSVDGGPTGPCVLAGPTCDSVDVLYEKVPVELPVALAEGDTVRLLSTGAYTSSYSTVGFNGFEPLPTYFV